MKHLFGWWREVKPYLEEHELMLFLDYDGTLTPIVKHPSLARLSSAVKRELRSLASAGGIKVAVVSGRSLIDLKHHVSVKRLIYVGNHGLELEGPSIHFIHPEALATQRLFEKLARKLKIVLQPFSGIYVENKKFTISIHYRQVSPTVARKARASFTRFMRTYLSSSNVVLTEGKKVWEIRPHVSWNKGTLVLWLLGRCLAQSSRKILPIFVGDDVTDEDAFRVLKRKGICIKVGNGIKDRPSEASYFLDSPREVLNLLKRLNKVKTKEKKSGVRL